jgi:exosome complex component RRP40
MEPELVCVDSYGKKAGLGVLSGGFVFTVPLNVIRKLLSPDCVLLSTLGANIPFEVAIGMNGRIWIRAKTTRDTISLANAIASAEFMNNEEIKRMVPKLVDTIKGF